MGKEKIDILIKGFTSESSGEKTLAYTWTLNYQILGKYLERNSRSVQTSEILDLEKWNTLEEIRANQALKSLIKAMGEQLFEEGMIVRTINGIEIFDSNLNSKAEIDPLFKFAVSSLLKYYDEVKE